MVDGFVVFGVVVEEYYFVVVVVCGFYFYDWCVFWYDDDGMYVE